MLELAKTLIQLFIFIFQLFIFPFQSFPHLLVVLELSVKVHAHAVRGDNYLLQIVQDFLLILVTLQTAFLRLHRPPQVDDFFFVVFGHVPHFVFVFEVDLFEEEALGDDPLLFFEPE